MLWMKIAAIYLALGTVVIALSPYKKHHLSGDVDLSSAPAWKAALFLSISFTLAVLAWPLMTKMIYTKPQTVLDIVEELGMKYFQQNNKLHAEAIRRISREVMGRFKKAAEERGETISGESLLAISLKFMRIYAMFGEEMYRGHLDYELEKYKNEGLRDDYW
ncbi:MAG: hypothetical protein RBR09_13445 [Desulfobulbaceae bacterium]|jgi:hypothetical protein|nr:hypothetical protein [Deltaproteobacteria bacterium]MDY0352253.1 hypothetical protein [Desulfobulbaceae bacterium]